MLVLHHLRRGRKSLTLPLVKGHLHQGRSKVKGQFCTKLTNNSTTLNNLSLSVIKSHLNHLMLMTKQDLRLLPEVKT